MGDGMYKFVEYKQSTVATLLHSKLSHPFFHWANQLVQKRGERKEAAGDQRRGAGFDEERAGGSCLRMAAPSASVGWAYIAGILVPSFS